MLSSDEVAGDGFPRSVLATVVPYFYVTGFSLARRSALCAGSDCAPAANRTKYHLTRIKLHFDKFEISKLVKNRAKFQKKCEICRNSDFGAVQRNAHLVDLEKS